MTTIKPRAGIVLAAFILCLYGCGGEPPPVAESSGSVVDHVNDLADRYYAFALKHTPEIAYFSGVELTRHDGMEDNSLPARRRREAVLDGLLEELRSIDPGELVGRTEWITHAYLLQELTALVEKRVCRSELWNVNQMGGWHLGYSQVAQLQPVGTPELRQQSLDRWARLAPYVDQEIENLRHGLELGYSAPQSVVRRVLDQLDGLLALDVEQSPFYAPAARDDDESFAAATRALVAERINPALSRYRDFLAVEYIEAARQELSITFNPDGRDCYEASLRAYTTLDRTGKEVFELGQETVDANRSRVIELGRSAYELTDFKAIMERAKNDPTDRFVDKDELLEFSQDAVRRSEREMPNWVGKMPLQPVEVVPFPEHEEGTGRSAHYRPGTAERPGEYRIPLHEPGQQSRGNAEGTAYHEAWPGHHLQVAVGQAVEGLHPITRIIWFSGPGEGWARYAEGLAEEMGLYVTTTGPIKRLAWPARGMVVDPGIHLFGWTREQAIDFMLESGRFPEAQGDEMVDRIAILPGQLTAYDSGGLEILALRRQAEAALGERFDIREFHDRVLENGTIPLKQLRTHIENWLTDEL
jgi:uncharacterized protein (DUF885 family)